LEQIFHIDQYNLPFIFIVAAASILLAKLLNDLILLIALPGRKSYIKNPKASASVSVVICARNEAENLKRFIPLICEQEYDSFEVVVVNDASTDNTVRVVRDLASRYENFRYTEIPKDPKFDHGKKFALTIGIKASKYKNLLLTDADCWPETDQWLVGMADKLQQKKIVLGYGGYEREKGLINSLIRFDTMLIARNFMGLARMGAPYMGVGRNLAYHKSIYEEAGGFSSHYHIKSGDDDLLVNQMARKSNTIVNLNPNHFTRSIAEKSFKLFYLQKKRHLTTGARYRFFQKIYLGFEGLLRVLTLPLLVLINIFTAGFEPYVYVTTGVFIVLQIIIWKILMNKYREKGFLLMVPFFEFFISILPIVILARNFIKRNQSR